MSYASAIEPLRAANLLAGREHLPSVRLFAGWRIGAVLVGRPRFPPHRCPARGSGLAYGLRLRRRLAARLARIRPCMPASGSWRAKACGSAAFRAALICWPPQGCLPGRDFTIHWEHAPALLEAFPDLTPRQARFVLDGNRITCGGGVAPLDMMHALIAERMGRGFRPPGQRLVSAYGGRRSRPHRSGPRWPNATASTIRACSAFSKRWRRRSRCRSIAQTMARIAGVTARHLDRLFSAHLAVDLPRAISPASGSSMRDACCSKARFRSRKSPLPPAFPALGIFRACFATAFGDAAPRDDATGRRFSSRLRKFHCRDRLISRSINMATKEN